MLCSRGVLCVRLGLGSARNPAYHVADRAEAESKRFERVREIHMHVALSGVSVALLLFFWS